MPGSMCPEQRMTSFSCRYSPGCFKPSCIDQLFPLLCIHRFVSGQVKIPWYKAKFFAGVIQFPVCMTHLKERLRSIPKTVHDKSAKFYRFCIVFIFKAVYRE